MDRFPGAGEGRGLGRLRPLQTLANLGVAFWVFMGDLLGA